MGDNQFENMCTEEQSMEDKTTATSATERSPSGNFSPVTIRSSYDDDQEEDEYRYNGSVQWLADWLSNILFLIGSMLYVYLAIQDIMDAYDEENGDDDGSGDDDDGVVDLKGDNAWQAIWALVSSSPYVWLSVLAASSYVIDALFQISILPCYDKQICSQTEPNDFDDSNHDNVDNGHNNGEIEHTSYYQHNNHALVPLVDNKDLESEDDNCCQEQKRSLGPLYGVITSHGFDAFTFGMAAFAELVGCLYVDQDEDFSNYMSMLAAHIYFVNASPLFLTSFHENYYWKSESLEDFGDLLFLSGVIIDVVLSYWELKFSSSPIVAWFYLLSAVLWLVDAIICIVAQWIYSEGDDEEDDNDNANYINLSSDKRSDPVSLYIENISYGACGRR